MNNEIKVTQLPSADTITQSDLFMIVQNDENKKATSNQIKDFVGGNLTDYVQKTDYATINDAGVIKANAQSGFSVENDGKPYPNTYTYNQYPSLLDGYFISKGTLENVITGKDLTTKAYVDGLVGDINTALDTINGEVI